MAVEEPSRQTSRPDEETPLLQDDGVVERNDSRDGIAHTRPSRRDSGEPEVQEPTSGNLLLQLGSAWVGVFLAGVDSTVIATISAPISSSFNSLSLLSWLASAYLISNAACQPLSGKLTDIFGRRTGLVISNVLFGAGNLICGLATEEWVMIFGRVVAGAGGGGLAAISTFLASDLVPLRKRGMWQGVGNICYGLGSGLGGIFGGWMNDTLGWRWAFLSQIPLIAVSTILVAIYVRVPVKETDMSRLKRIDFLGAASLVTALVVFLLGLSTGGNQFPWTHPVVLTSLPLSAILLLFFIYVEEKIALEPMIPVRLLLDRTVLSCCLTNWFGLMSVFAVFFYLPIYLQVQGYSATMAGLRLVVNAVGLSLGSLGIGTLMRMTGRYLYFSYGAVLLIVVGVGVACGFTLDTPPVFPYISMFVYGSGHGSMLTVTLVAVIAAVDHEYQAVVTSATYAFRSTGSSIGVTVATAVFQNLLKSGLWSRFGGRDGASELIPKLRDSLDQIELVPGDWRPGVLDAYMDALRGVFFTSLGIAVLAMMTNFAMKEHKLYMNLQRK